MVDDDSPIQRDPAVDEFLDGLDERIGKKACPVCGEHGWISMPVPGYLPLVAEFSLAGLGALKLACLVCAHCYFFRSHVMDPEWHDAIAALASQEKPSSSD
jgi:hypothetical protein